MNEDLNKRFVKIIIMCQDAKKRYGDNYETKYKSYLQRFSKEIQEKDLVNKCTARNFAVQLCIHNGIEF